MKIKQTAQPLTPENVARVAANLRDTAAKLEAATMSEQVTSLLDTLRHSAHGWYKWSRVDSAVTVTDRRAAYYARRKLVE